MTKCRNFNSTLQLVRAAATADTEFTVLHELGTIPRGAFVLKSNSTGIFYRAGTFTESLAANFMAGWEFEDSGNLGKNTGSSSLDLTNSGVTQVAGQVGNAGHFVTAESDYLYHASDANFVTGDIDFTFAAWVKLTDKTASQMLVSKEGVGAANADYDLYYDVTANRFTGRVWITGATQKTAVANSLGSPSAGVWYLLVYWHDATANTVNIQVNNGTVDSTATTASLQAPAAGAFQIGARDNSTSRLFANADIDQVMFWKRVLTSAERTALYNGGAGLTVASAIAPVVFTAKEWTATEAYLKCSVGSTQAYIMFFA